jgi:nuclear pore complex protein Nup107
VREMYIPELVIRLHRVLYESRSLLPRCVSVCALVFNSDTHHRNIKSALLLANTVADSRYEIYDAFHNPHGNRLGEYLQCIKEAVLGGLEGGGSDPFRIVAS